jgi:hypothetical protein
MAIISSIERSKNICDRINSFGENEIKSTRPQPKSVELALPLATSLT